MFKGILTAQITPFKNGKVDIEKFGQLIKRQKDAKTNGIVIGGCTGESFTLEQEDCNLLWEEAIKYKSSDFKIIFGIAHNSTKRSIEMIKVANKYKPDGLLVITPFANKPSQAGLLQYYNAIAEVSEIPIILYNVPGRTAVSISAETVQKLSANPKIIGIKQALSDFDEFTKLRMALNNFCLLSGEDSLTFPSFCIGFDGVICTSSNLIPELWVEMYQNFIKGNIEKAAQIHLKIFPLIKALFLEGNPAPLKYAMKVMKLYNGELREPLVEVSENTKKQIESELKNLNLI
ncbi:MAG: 4-hydroxy-tetrahydrodipicolinate synthase [Spirochaetota bacterium]